MGRSTNSKPETSADDIEVTSEATNEFSVVTESTNKLHCKPPCSVNNQKQKEIMPLAAKFTDLKTVQENAQLKQKAITTFFETMVCMGETLPKEMEVYCSQIDQVKGVMGSRFAEIMADGVIDPEDAESALELITKQLFDADGILGKSQESTNEFMKSFDTLDTEEGFMTIVRSAQKTVRRKEMVATGYEYLYQLTSFAQPHLADQVCFVTLFVVSCAMMLPLMSILRSALLSIAVAGLAVAFKLKNYGAGPHVRSASSLELERRELSGLLDIGSQIHMVTAAIDKSLKTIKIHAHSLENQKSQIRHLLQNKQSVKRFSPERLAEFLAKNSLGHASPPLLEKCVDGKTFMNADIINKESLEGKFGIDPFDVQRLLSLRDQAMRGDEQPSDSAKKLADSVNATLDQIQKDAKLVEQKVLSVLQSC